MRDRRMAVTAPKKRLVHGTARHHPGRCGGAASVLRLGVTLSHLDLHRESNAVSPNSSRVADAAEARTCAAAAAGRRCAPSPSSCWKNTNRRHRAADRRRRRSASRHSAHSAAVACTTKLRANRPRACVSPLDHPRVDGGGQARPSHECTPRRAHLPGRVLDELQPRRKALAQQCQERAGLAGRGAVEDTEIAILPWRGLRRRPRPRRGRTGRRCRPPRGHPRVAGHRREDARLELAGVGDHEGVSGIGDDARAQRLRLSAPAARGWPSRPDTTPPGTYTAGTCCHRAPTHPATSSRWRRAASPVRDRRSSGSTAGGRSPAADTCAWTPVRCPRVRTPRPPRVATPG